MHEPSEDSAFEVTKKASAVSEHGSSALPTAVVREAPDSRPRLGSHVAQQCLQAEALKEASILIRQHASSLSEQSRGLNGASRRLRDEASRLRAAMVALRENQPEVARAPRENGARPDRNDR